MLKSRFLIILLLIFSNFAWGQLDTSSTSLFYFQKQTDYIDSRNVVFTQKKSLNFPLLNSIGYTNGSSIIISRAIYCYAIISINQITPQKLTIDDTLTTTITGSYMDALIGFDLLNKVKKVDLALLFGFEFGRLRLYGNPLLRKKNGYFAPKIEIQPKFKIKRIVIGGAIGYGYDISNPNWKNTLFSDNNNYSLEKLRQSGFSWQVLLGWSFN